MSAFENGHSGVTAASMSEVGTPNANIQRISDGIDATQVGIHLMPIPMDLVDRALARVGTERRAFQGLKWCGILISLINRLRFIFNIK
jgi:hypothetical protein